MKTAPSQERVHVSGKRHGIDRNDKDSSASKSCGFKMVDPKMPQFAGHAREYDFHMLLTQDYASDMQFSCCSQVYRENL